VGYLSVIRLFWEVMTASVGDFGKVSDTEALCTFLHILSNIAFAMDDRRYTVLCLAHYEPLKVNFLLFFVTDVFNSKVDSYFF
jgi:hypothetical protein